MKVLILGGGRIGFGIAKVLAIDEHDVSVVDSSPKVLKDLAEKIDVKPVFGDATDINILKEAGIESANIVIAATPYDEINITACQFAGFLFNVETKIARISKRSFFNSSTLFSKSKFQVDLIVSPEQEIANTIKRGISIAGALDVISCADNKLKVIGVKCKPNAAIVNVQMKYISTLVKDFNISILYIKRKNGEQVLPGKSDFINAEDEVYFACDPQNVVPAMKLFGYENTKTNNVILIGGGKIYEDILNPAWLSDLEIKIKIIEKNLNYSEFLAEKLENTEIFNGDPLNESVLQAADIANSGSVIAVTEDDKTNILSCLFAKKLGAQRVSAVLNDFSYSKLIYSFGINTILDSRQSTVLKVLHHIRKGGIENVITFADTDTEIFMANVLDNSYIVGILSDNITSKNEIYIGALVRDDEVFILPKKILIKAGDKILFISKHSAMERILKLLQAKPSYLS